MNMLKKLIVGAITASAVLSSSALADLPNFTKLIKENAKTVVQIESHDLGRRTAERSTISPYGQPIPEDFLRYFFGTPPNGSLEEIPQRPSLSHGSGFFIDDKGYVLTNAHVVKGGDKITVSTTDQKEYQAELIGLDERTDVALLKIDKNDTPSVKIGNSDKVEVGNWVLAIGSPFGFDYTATKGIVSAVSRSLPDGTYVPFIQTDAAVNPGNSGGPLFNLDGEVIGINSQIYSRTGTFNGLAFAIPINTAMHIAKQLKAKGFASRGWLGVGIQTVNQDLATSFGLDKPLGALVASVMPESPAEAAGLKTGDIILQFDGKAIKKSSDLPPLVGSIAAGTEVEMEILRKGKEKTLSVTIGELDEGHPKVAEKSGKSVNKGLTVRNLSDEQKSQMKIDDGVVVVNVQQGSPAAKAGFRIGDVIVNIDNREIDDVKAFAKALKKSGDKPVAVLVVRGKRSLFIPL
ncbi:MAG: serine peptidase [Gammaproteobacteria bacterium]|nr:MAG: serine peptidase [Gammaproteobacteria bacterium]